MCLEKDIVIIAIFGKSCTGKTKIADSLSELMNVPVRHCSQAVINRSKQLNCAPAEMPIEEHSSIDLKTREIASGFHKNYIIEGSFLPYVLWGLPNILWLELVCDSIERNRRYKERHRLDQEAQKIISGRDISDETLANRLYGSQRIKTVNITKIDTTSKSIQEITSLIISILKAEDGDKA